MSEIILSNVGLYYPIYRYSRSLKRTLVKIATGGRIADKNNKIIIHALQNITFTLNKGDRLGLIGHNGAGKSTLLKVLAGIYEPQYGDLHVKGKVSPLLDIHVGMQFEATGHENIKIRRLILDLPRQEQRKIILNVEKFAELGNFIAMPVKTYSAGMAMRLAFSMSTAITPDILLLDEVIGTADANFLNKIPKRIEELVEKSNIVVFSSHVAGILQKFCNKILWLEHGAIKYFGGPEILDLYTNHSSLQTDITAQSLG